MGCFSYYGWRWLRLTAGCYIYWHFSIAGKPGIAPGFIIGLTANAVGAGFIGGILGGYLAGYLVLAILKYVKLPNWARGLMPTLIIPFLTLNYWWINHGIYYRDPNNGIYFIINELFR